MSLHLSHIVILIVTKCCFSALTVGHPFYMTVAEKKRNGMFHRRFHLSTSGANVEQNIP